MNIFESLISGEGGRGVQNWILTGLAVLLIIGACYLLYRMTRRWLVHGELDRSREYRITSLLRFVFALIAVGIILGLLTNEWLGLLMSVGVIGILMTVVLQTPFLSVLGWLYIMVRQPFEAGDRVKIGDVKGEVLSIDLLATSMLQVGGEFVTSNQPSGVLVTIPNANVLTSTVENHTSKKFPWIWNEISVQVAFESDIDFVQEIMIGTADELIGEQMEAMIGDYRTFLKNTPLEIEIGDRPSVNLIQRESWVECRLRYLTKPRKAQTIRNQLYEQILTKFNEHPERVKFPSTRSR